MDQSVRKEQLMKEFLGSVKACQIKYSGGRELATEVDPRVRSVCASVEQLLCHGVRPAAVPSATQSTIRQVTEYVSAGLQLGLSGGDSNGSSNGTSPPAQAAWGFLCCQLTPHEGSRFLQLRRVSCDTGRLRAWVRSALNERSLERYIRMICSEAALLQRWFEPWALLRDASHTAALPSLAQGVGGIFFALTIDKAELCSGAQCPQHTSSGVSGAKKEQPDRAAHLLAALPRSKSKDEGLSSAALKKREFKRRRKKVPSQLVSFDEDSSCGIAEEATEDSPLWVRSAPTTCLNSPALAAAATPCQDTLSALASAAAASSASKAKREQEQDGCGEAGERCGDAVLEKNTREGHEALLKRVLDDRSPIDNRLGSSNSSLVSYSNNFVRPSQHRRSKSDIDASRVTKNVLDDRPFSNSSSRKDDCHASKPFQPVTNCDNSSRSSERRSTSESKDLKESADFSDSISCSNNDEGGRQALSSGRTDDVHEDSEDVGETDHMDLYASSSADLTARDYVRSESSYSAVLEELLEAHGGSEFESHGSEFNTSKPPSSVGVHDDTVLNSSRILGGQTSVASSVDVTNLGPSLGSTPRDASTGNTDVRSEKNGFGKNKGNLVIASPVTLIKSQEKSCSKEGDNCRVRDDFSSPQLKRVTETGRLSESDTKSPINVNAKDKSHDCNGYDIHPASSAQRRRHLDSSSSECDSPVVSFQPDARETLGSSGDSKTSGPELGQLQGVLRSEAGSDLDFGSYKSSLSNLSVGSALSSDADGGATAAASCVAHHETSAGANTATRGVPAPAPSSFTSASSGSGTRTAEQLVPSSLTQDELRAAVLALSRSREASDRRRRATEARAEAAEAECEAARREIEDSKLRSETRQRETDARLEALQRENSLLRKQLGKYISAVQLLKRNNMSDCSSEEATLTTATPSTTVATGATTATKATAITVAAAADATSCDGAPVPVEGMVSDTPGARVRPSALPPPPTKFHDYHTEAAAYESKLVQVAEMHGELFEFSERLQRIIRVRETQISALRVELESLRGPLPEDASLEQQLQRLQHQHQQHSSDETDTVSLCSTDVLGGGGLVSVPPPLINVWIPSAFLVGGGTVAGGAAPARGGDQHHVYQVFVRIRDDEWTVFRRFAHFHQLHKQLSRTYPAVRSLSFPQKKPFGYREESVVTARRGALQEYLRHVVNTLLRSSPQLAAAPDRGALTALLPFLAEDTGSGGGTGRPTRQVLALPQYSGL